VNVDHKPGPGVDVVAPAEDLPFESGSVGYVYASHVLEHVEDLDRAMRELHRVLKPGGILLALVPYGLRSLYNPYHLRPFDGTSFDRFTRASPSLDEAPLFEVVRRRVRRGPPLEWHLRTYLPRVYRALYGDGTRVDSLVGVKREIVVCLRKRAET
jgi:SAM-dependent methyltransferase